MTEGLLEEKKDLPSSHPVYDCLNVPIATGLRPVSRNECGWSISAKRFTPEQCYQVHQHAILLYSDGNPRVFRSTSQVHFDAHLWKFRYPYAFVSAPM
jgi:hypothetical protein